MIAGIVTVTIVGLLFLAIVVLAVRILFGEHIRDWREARYWKQMGDPFTPSQSCEHLHCKMHVSDVGPGGAKGRYAWVVCLDCGTNLTGGPLRVGDSPERGWRP